MIVERNGLAVGFDVEALGRLGALAQTGEDDPERAGFMLGRMRSRDRVDVTALTEPGPRCTGSRTECYMDSEHHIAAIRAAWDESGGEVFTLGHWHTHPEPDPTPSQLDLDDWTRRLREDDFAGLRHVAFAIVGTERIRVWLGEVGTGQIEPMTETERAR